MAQKQTYTVSIVPRMPESDLSRTPRSIVFSSRIKAMYFWEEARKLIKESGRNFYVTLEETQTDDMGYLEDLRDDLEDLNQCKNKTNEYANETRQIHPQRKTLQEKAQRTRRAKAQFMGRDQTCHAPRRI